MAPKAVPLAGLAPPWETLDANCLGIRAASCERTSVTATRRSSVGARAHLRRAINRRRCCQQRCGIGMAWALKDLLRTSFLHRTPTIENVYAVTVPRCNVEVMSD